MRRLSLNKNQVIRFIILFSDNLNSYLSEIKLDTSKSLFELFGFTKSDDVLSIDARDDSLDQLVNLFVDLWNGKSQNNPFKQIQSSPNSQFPVRSFQNYFLRLMKNQLLPMVSQLTENVKQKINELKIFQNQSSSEQPSIFDNVSKEFLEAKLKQLNTSKKFLEAISKQVNARVEICSLFETISLINQSKNDFLQTLDTVQGYNLVKVAEMFSTVMNESDKVITEEFSFYDEIKLNPLQNNHLNELIKIIDESVHEQKKLLEEAMEVLKQSQFKNTNAPVPSLVESQECPR